VDTEEVLALCRSQAELHLALLLPRTSAAR